MNPESGMSSQELALGFFTWAKGVECPRLGPVAVNPHRYWPEWYGAGSPEGATPEQRAAIESDKGGRGALVHALRCLLAGELPDHSEAYFHGMQRLFACEPFSQWDEFKEREEWGMGGFRAMIVDSVHPGSASDVKVLECIAIPKSQGPAIFPDNFQVNEKSLADAHKAAGFVLRRRLFALFFYCFFLGRRPKPRIRAGIPGWVSTAAWTGTALSVLAPMAIQPGLGGVGFFAALMCAMCLGAIIATFARCVAEWMAFRREADQAIRLFDHSQFVLRLSKQMKVEGRSLGALIAVSVIRAVLAAKPRAGQLGWLGEQLQAAKDKTGVTGRITPRGWIRPVDLTHKFPAANAYKLPVLAVPIQADASSLAPHLPGVSFPVGKLSYATGYASDRPRVLRLVNLSQGLMSIARAWSIWAAAKTAAALLLVFVIGWQLNGVGCALRPPAIPNLFFKDTGRAPGNRMHVALATSRPGCFCVRLDSDDFFNRKADVVWRPGEDWPRAEFVLTARPGHPDAKQGRVEIKRVRRFILWGVLSEERVGYYDLPLLEHPEGDSRAK